MPELATETRTQLSAVAPVYLVDNVTSTAEYYRDTLGFTIEFLYGYIPFYGSVKRDKVNIHFRESIPHGQRNSVSVHGPGDTIDAYILVNNVDALAEEFRSRGANILQGPITQEYGMRELNVDDCNGYRLCFGQQF